MSNKQSEIKNIVNSLTDFEKELENVKNEAIVKKTELIRMVETNTEKIRNEIVQETNLAKENNIKKIIEENKAKAKDIGKAGENQSKKLQTKIDSKFNSVVKLVIKKILEV